MVPLSQGDVVIKQDAAVSREGSEAGDLDPLLSEDVDLPKAFHMQDLIFPIYIPSIFSNIALECANLLLPVFVTDHLGASTSMAGYVVSASGVGRMLSNISIGKFVGQSGIKVTMVVGLAVLTIAGFTAALSKGVLILILARMLTGTGSSMFQVARQTFFSANVFGHEGGIRGASSRTTQNCFLCLLARGGVGIRCASVHV